MRMDNVMLINEGLLNIIIENENIMIDKIKAALELFLKLQHECGSPYGGWGFLHLYGCEQ
jgi:hypothetical protein